MYEAFRNALDAEDVEEGISLYATIKSDRLLDSKTFAQLARILHNRYRLSRDHDEKSMLASYAGVLATDLQKGIAPPSPEGSLRLISFFKEAKLRAEGLQFWKWLVKQSDEYVDARVYGAAIELLALSGERLDTIEALYSQGMKRFPSGFIEYHFSPYAVLPEPGQRQRVKGLSQSLLQGIITARMMLGDIYGAYLGLDTALRLFHYQMLPRICEIFVQSRTIPEAYKVLLTAVRTGVRLKAPMLRVLQTRMLHWQQSAKPYSDKLQLSERSLNAFYAYITSGNQLFYTNVGLLVKSMTQLMNPPRPIDMELSEYIEFRKEIRKSLCDPTFETVETIIEGEMAEPEISVYNTLISMAGRSRNRILFGRILQQIELHDLKPDNVTYKVVLTAAGLLEDAEIVRSTWNILADTFVINDKTKVAHENRFRLREACKNAGCMDFYYAQVRQGSEEEDSDRMHAMAAGRGPDVDDSEARPDQKSESAAAMSSELAKSVSGMNELAYDLIPKMTPADPDEIRSRVQHLKGQMEAICEVARGVKRPSLYANPISIDLTEVPEAVTKIVSPSRRVMRAVYEELITDPYRSTLDQVNIENPSEEELSTETPGVSLDIPPHEGAEARQQAASDSSTSESSSVSSSTSKHVNTITTDTPATTEQPSPPKIKTKPKPDAKNPSSSTSETNTVIPTSSSDSPEPETTPTGYPLSEIRFANWLSMTELLVVARIEQKRQQAVIDRAIALGISMPTALRRSDENSPSKLLRDPDAVGVFDGFREAAKGTGKDSDDDGSDAADAADAKYDEVVDRVEVAQIKKRVAPLRYPGTESAAAADDDPTG